MAAVLRKLHTVHGVFPHLDADFQAVPLHVQGPIRGVSHPQQQWQQSVGSAADGV